MQSIFWFLIISSAFLYACLFHPIRESGIKKLSLKNDVILSKIESYGINDCGILLVKFPDFINE